MRVESVGSVMLSPTRALMLEMWREKMSPSARLKQLMREPSPAETEWRKRRAEPVDPAVRIHISLEAKRLNKT